MITITNRQQLDGIPFSTYLTLPGMGFSGIRNPEGMAPTSKMRFGSLVDTFLFTPNEYDGTDKELVYPLAQELQKVLPINIARPQVSLLADFTVDGLTMPFRGRPDMVIGTKLIVDLKVSALDTVKAIQYFRYDWQQSGYMLAAGIEKAVICSIHPKTKKITLIPIPLTTDWWEHQAKRLGTIKAERVG